MLDYFKTEYTSPFGTITLCSDGKNLVGLWFNNQKYFGNNYIMFPNDKIEIFYNVKKWLDRYFQKQQPDINEIPFKPEGTIFRKKVWKILCKIPYGKVITYSDVTKQIICESGCSNMSFQAVGSAIGHNPISIIIPCHRVIGKNGNLTGYAAGVEVKEKLLRLENANINLK